MINLIIHLLSNVKPVMFFVLLGSTSNSYIFFSPVYIDLLKFNNRNTRKRCEICSKLSIKTPNDVGEGFCKNSSRLLPVYKSFS